VVTQFSELQSNSVMPFSGLAAAHCQHFAAITDSHSAKAFGARAERLCFKQARLTAFPEPEQPHLSGLELSKF